MNAANSAAWSSAIHSPAAWAFTLALAIAFPLVDWVVYLRARTRVAIYIWNIAAEWSLVAVCAWILWHNRLTLADLRQDKGNLLRIFLTAELVGVAFAVITALGKRRKKNVSAAQLKKAAAGVERLIPQTRQEQVLFAAVSLTAGLCEEFLYRGWLLHLFTALLGAWWMGLIVSSVLFGLGHIYQGRSGVLGSGVLGVVFGLIVIWCGTLWVAQLLHAAINLNNGFSIARALKQTPGTDPTSEILVNTP